MTEKLSQIHNLQNTMTKKPTCQRLRGLRCALGSPERGARALPCDKLAMGFMAMFKKKDPKDMVREWQSKMRTEMRGVDRQIRGALASRTSRRRGTFPRSASKP